MFKKFAIAGAVLMAAAALYAALFVPEQDVQASSSAAPISVDVELVEAVAAPLQIDPETGLPMGAVMFQAGDQTCLAVPGYDLECWCPCETGSCAEVAVPLTSTVEITDTTSTVVPPPDDTPDVIPPPDTPDSTPEPTPEPTPDPTPEPTPKPKCNQGVGNGPEGCDPGNSNHNQPSNDEGDGDAPGNPGRGGGNGNNNNNGGNKGKGNNK